MMPQPVREQPPEQRERLAEEIADRMDGPVTALGVIFLLLVLAETVIRPVPAVSTVFTIAGWIIWAAFVAEFAVRLAIAPSTARFLRRNWWQIIFLALPFLRFVRVLGRLRLRSVVRGGRVLSSAVRGTRTAGRTLSGRLGWLGAITGIIVLASSQLLFEFAGYDTYGSALHDAALATVAAEPLNVDHWLPDILEVALAIYSVIVFATLAGMVGAFFLERQTERGREADVASESAADPTDGGPVSA